MSNTLQVALFLASLAIVVFVVFFIPIFIMMCSQLARVVRQIEDLRTEVKLLVRDSQTMVQNINNLTSHARQQMEDVDKAVHAVRSWTARANRIVEEIGDVVEAPILTATRFITVLHKALTGFAESRAKKDHQANVDNTRTPNP